MQLEEYLEIISPDVIRLKGSSVALEQIVERYRIGYDAVEINQDFPELSLEQIYGAITYYLHNREEVHAYLKRLPPDRAESVQPAKTRFTNDIQQRIRAVLREHEPSILA